MIRSYLLQAVGLALVSSSLVALSPAADNPTKLLAIGTPAPDFALPGVDGKTHTLADFKSAKWLLVVFTCNHCPTAQAYEQRIIDLHKDYKDKGVTLVAISPNDDAAVRLDELGYTDVSDSLADMKLRAKERDFQFPYLYDGEKQDVSRAYGVLATPQVLIFDAERKLRYVGRIDDSDVKTVTSHDTRNALDALLAGKPVPVETTRVFGCSTKWSDKREEARKWLEKAEAEEVKLTELDEAALTKLAKNDTDKLLVVNVWATWCGPCVAELPELVTINRMYRKRDFQMITISLDEPENKAAAQKVLTEKKVATTNYISAVGSKDKFADLLDKEWQGPVPFTLLIAPGGKVIYRKAGPLEPLTVKRAVVDYLGRTYAGRK
ncbi:redoxin domain-containing protein [Anatilimnocola floriformis]|uniref:redoxin domain-containing protein n=1 Tax=Anatilimnocola floriformis TaxID=2948575 RepID=UPI0020C3BED8|nr:redoxin domain-containing protein [Anatilimnocola floriformis]